MSMNAYKNAVEITKAALGGGSTSLQISHSEEAATFIETVYKKLKEIETDARRD